MTSVAVGFSESFDTVEAAAEAADVARAGLDGPADLCVLFASGPHLPMAKWLLSEVHERLEPRNLIGCGAGGTLASGREVEEGPGLAVWAASMPRAELATLHVTAERTEQGFRLLGMPKELPGEEQRLGRRGHRAGRPLQLPLGGAAERARALAAWGSRAGRAGERLGRRRQRAAV